MIPRTVSLSQLFLDPNNPRLAPQRPPGYTDLRRIIDPTVQAGLERQVQGAYDVASLEESIASQGWVAMDAMVVLRLPDTGTPDELPRYVVLEGNTRTVALRRIGRTRLAREQRSLESLQRDAATPASALQQQQALVQRLAQVVQASEVLMVLEIEAGPDGTVDPDTLMAILAVRNINGPKAWSAYAIFTWLLQRYEAIFAEMYPGRTLCWDMVAIKRIAEVASIKPVVAKRGLMAAACFKHFKEASSGRLPEGESLLDSDFYLFDSISKKRWLRQVLGLGDNGMHLSAAGQEAIFQWVFRLPRPRRSDDNPNTLFRHENILLWEQMHRYDMRAGTRFAAELDVHRPAEAPRFRDLLARYEAHKAQRAPAEAFDEVMFLLDQVRGVPDASLQAQAEALAPKADAVLEVLEGLAQRLRGMRGGAQAWREAS